MKTMIILALDLATTTGWAIYDTDSTVSSIICGSIHLEGDIFEKCEALREEIRKLRLKYKPNYGIYERALQIATKFPGKGKKDLFGQAQDKEDVDVIIGRLRNVILRGNAKKSEIATLKQQIFGDEPTINVKTTALQNHMTGFVQGVFLGIGIHFESIPPRTWQQVIPAHITANDPKERVRLYCDHLNIVGGNKDARDAAMIAVWAARESQLLKSLTAKLEHAA